MVAFRSAFWSVSLPSAWTGHNEAECATFIGENNIGALQISAARKDGEVTEEDLLDFAQEHLANGARIRSVTAGEFSGFTFSYGDEENFWRQWFLRRGSLALFVTYNCPVHHMHEEDTPINAILGSLKSEI